MTLVWELLRDGPAGSLKEEMMMSPVPSACYSPSVFHDHCLMPSFTHILILILAFARTVVIDTLQPGEDAQS